MPAISNKGRQMPESPIRKLVPYAEAAKKRGVNVFHLNIGQPDIKSPQKALDAIRNIDLEVVEYSLSGGVTSYREKLAKYYQNIGLEISADNVMITTGGSEALLFGFMSCLDPGDEVIVTEPFYANYNGFATAAGVKVVPIVSSIDSGFALPDLSKIEDQINDRTKAILVCNPGNPTGYLYTDQEIQKIAEFAIKYDLFVFADEVYREFCYDGREHKSIMSVKGLEEHAIMIDSVSKRYSMCGARIGSVVTKNQTVMDTMMKFAQARLSPPTFGQIAGEAALDTGQEYFDEVTEEYTHRRNLMVNALNEIPGVMCPMPMGAFYCVAALPIEDAEDFCRWMLESFEQEGSTIMLAPANGFYSKPDLGKNQVRLAYVLNVEDLKKSLICLSLGLEAYKDQLTLKAETV